MNYSILSGVDLMMTVFPEEDFCVQDVVPKGLVILTGEDLEPVRTLAMDMCLRVVKGERLWQMDTRQGAVLYMIHRYNLAATRNLILEMSDRVPDELYIGVMPESSLELAVSGIRFEKPLEMPDRGSRPVHYAGKTELEKAILGAYPAIHTLPVAESAPTTGLNVKSMPNGVGIKTTL